MKFSVLNEVWSKRDHLQKNVNPFARPTGLKLLECAVSKMYKCLQNASELALLTAGKPYLEACKKMGCLKLTYQEKEDGNFFQGLWKKGDGQKNCDNYYPFGLTFNSYQRENSTPNQYKFNGIEEQDELGLNVYQAFFRTMDPTIGRWWQIDPKADEYYSWSPFNAMGNNPVNITDPLGDKWKDKADERMAERTSNQLHKQEQRLQKQEQKLESRIAKAESKGNTGKVEKLTTQKESVGAARQDVATAQTEISAMGADENKTFHFNQLPAGQQVGNVSTDKDGTIVINYVNGAFGNTVHELKHASQIQQGSLTPIPGTDIVKFTGITPIDSETQAYQRQFSAAPGSLPPSDTGTPTTHGGVNGDYVRGVNYNDASGKKVYPYSDKMYKIKK